MRDEGSNERKYQIVIAEYSTVLNNYGNEFYPFYLILFTPRIIFVNPYKIEPMPYAKPRIAAPKTYLSRGSFKKVGFSAPKIKKERKKESMIVCYYIVL